MKVAPSLKEQQQAVADWNSHWSPGVLVEVRLDGGTLQVTRTRSEAWLLGGHTAVVLVEQIAGAYSLWRFRPLTTEKPKEVPA